MPMFRNRLKLASRPFEVFRKRLRLIPPNLLKAIEIEPDFYEAYYALGLVLMRSGETDQARNYLAMFEQKRLAAKEQSVLGAGMLSEGRQ